MFLVKGYSHSKLEFNSFHQKIASVDKPMGDNSITNHKTNFKRRHPDKLKEANYQNKIEYSFQQLNFLFCNPG